MMMRGINNMKGDERAESRLIEWDGMHRKTQRREGKGKMRGE